jgi:hypothetical protein
MFKEFPNGTPKHISMAYLGEMYDSGFNEHLERMAYYEAHVKPELDRLVHQSMHLMKQVQRCCEKGLGPDVQQQLTDALTKHRTDLETYKANKHVQQYNRLYKKPL